MSDNATGTALNAVLDSLIERPAELLDGLTTASGDASLRWLSSFVQRITGADHVFVCDQGSESGGYSMFNTWSEGSERPAIDYDPRRGPLASHGSGGEAAVCVTGARSAHPNDGLLRALCIDAYISFPLMGDGEQPLGYIALLYAHALNIQEIDFATHLMGLLGPRAQSELQVRCTRRDLQWLAERPSSTESSGVLAELAVAMANAMQVKAVYVAVPVADSPQQLATLALVIDGALRDNVTFSNAGTPEAEAVPGQEAFYPEAVRQAFPRDPLLATTAAESYLGATLCDSRGQILGQLALLHDEPMLESPASSVVFHALRNQMAVELAARRADQAKEAAESAMLETLHVETMGMLATGVAHDLNNLLACIQGNTDLARSLLARDHSAQEYLEDAQATTKRAGGLCRQMLAYATRKRSSEELLDINELTRDLTRLMQVAITAKAALELELDRDPVLVQAVPAQLQQIVMNLVTNAADSMNNGRGTIRIETGVARSPNATAGDATPMAYLRVADDGCGMDRDTLERAFTPYFTTKTDGHGLGLAALQGVVKRHGGFLVVTSEPAQGSTFTVWLPCAEAAAVQHLATIVKPGRVDPSGVIVLPRPDGALRTASKKPITRIMPAGSTAAAASHEPVDDASRSGRNRLRTPMGRL